MCVHPVTTVKLELVYIIRLTKLCIKYYFPLVLFLSLFEDLLVCLKKLVKKSHV